MAIIRYRYQLAPLHLQHHTSERNFTTQRIATIDLFILNKFYSVLVVPENADLSQGLDFGYDIELYAVEKRGKG